MGRSSRVISVGFTRILTAAVAFSAAFFLFGSTAVVAGTVDLGMTPEDINFSTTTFVAGDRVRIYAKILNLGTEDVSGYVAFFQGSVPVGNTQVLTVRAGGVLEEVFVDFVVPTGTFNIRAQIQGTDPVDQNPSNDSTVTGLFTPVLDDDRDGAENASDNCPSVENVEQADQDTDGVGDVCDDDDDNDGVTDRVETELGSNPFSNDTDGDGLSDKEDPKPTVAKKTAISSTEPTSPSPVPSPSPPSALPASKTSTAVSSVSPPSDSSLSKEAEIFPVSSPESRTDEEEVVESTQSEPTEQTAFVSSPRAIFTYRKIDWKTYEFSAQLPKFFSTHVLWDFGDGVTSQRSDVRHTFQGSGDFLVRMRVTDEKGKATEDQIFLSVPFFTFENRLAVLLIGFLSALLLFTLSLWARARRDSPAKRVSEQHHLSVREAKSGAEEQMIPIHHS
ncbi:MAG TPA: thrombospondin type 3 repeat-containing protein [Patescibacteria group bacterium]|nr:thrombospondin type 3 repeat-containing protein [Patescibacteria group bacterium]